MGLRGSCEQKAASQCKGTSASFGSYVLRAGAAFRGRPVVTPPHPLAPARSTPFLCQMMRSRYEDPPCLPGPAGHTQFARLAEPNSVSPDSSPIFAVIPPMDRIFEAIEAEIQRLQAARALLAGDTNSAQSGLARTGKKNVATGRYRASGRMPRGSTHVI
jgi:hypothetical protein